MSEDYTAIAEALEKERKAIEREREILTLEAVEGYEDLARILMLAYNQAARGKGVERHGVKGEIWSEQPIIRHQRAYGVGFTLGQAAKKAEEAMSLPSDRARFELLGSIVYLAAAIKYLEELNGAVSEG